VALVPSVVVTLAPREMLRPHTVAVGEHRTIMLMMVDVKVRGTMRAAPDAVFAFLADLENWPRWQSDMQTTTLVEGQRAQPGARYRYISKAMGQTFDSTIRLVRADAPREVAFEGEWAGMIRPSGRYLIEPAPEGTLVTLNPHPETRGLGMVMAPLIGIMIKRLNRKHLDDLRHAVERPDAP
jgi:uncharacterized protein YndB with AHSA1/START domain